jgi:hypothetical protein
MLHVLLGNEEFFKNTAHDLSNFEGWKGKGAIRGIADRKK